MNVLPNTSEGPNTAQGKVQNYKNECKVGIKIIGEKSIINEWKCRVQLVSFQLHIRDKTICIFNSVIKCHLHWQKKNKPMVTCTAVVTGLIFRMHESLKS